MTRAVRIRAEAEAELSAAAAWYESKLPGLGVDFVAVVEEALERIGRNPEQYAQWRDDRSYRRCVLRRFPYVVFFTAANESILVMAVAHARRRPGYWLDPT